MSSSPVIICSILVTHAVRMASWLPPGQKKSKSHSVTSKQERFCVMTVTETLDRSITNMGKVIPQNFVSWRFSQQRLGLHLSHSPDLKLQKCLLNSLIIPCSIYLSKILKINEHILWQKDWTNSRALPSLFAPQIKIFFMSSSHNR